MSHFPLVVAMHSCILAQNWTRNQMNILHVGQDIKSMKALNIILKGRLIAWFYLYFQLCIDFVLLYLHLLRQATSIQHPHPSSVWLCYNRLLRFSFPCKSVWLDCGLSSMYEEPWMGMYFMGWFLWKLLGKRKLVHLFSTFWCLN